MDLNSIVIKLVKKGFANQPSYNLTVYGDGRVLYESVETGTMQAQINKEQVLAVFSSLKDSGFFSLSESNNIDINSGKPYTKVHVELPGDGNAVKTKEIIYYDYQIPANLKNFENDMNRLVGSKDAVSKAVEAPKKSFSFDFILDKKILLPLVAIVAVIIVVLFAASSGLFDMTADVDNNGSGVGDDVDGDDTVETTPPEIVFITTTSQEDRINEERPPAKYTFNQGDIVYIDYEVSNANHNGSVNVLEELSVYYSDESIVYLHNQNYPSVGTSDETIYIITSFNTSLSVWTAGTYTINITLTDEISDEKTSIETSFNLIGEGSATPEVEISSSNSATYTDSAVSFSCTYANFDGDLSFSWNFDDGSTSTLENPSHSFSNAGEYEVTLAVADNTGNTAYDSITITVAEESTSTESPKSLKAEITSISPSENFYDPNQEITFTGSASGGTGTGYFYQWDFDFIDDFTDSGQNTATATHSYSETGLKVIVLRVTDSDGNIDEDTELILVAEM